MSTTIGELIEWSSTNYPRKTALIYKRKNQAYTFSELNEKVNQLANEMLQLGIKKDDVVSTFLYNTSEFVIALFATAKIGAVFNPINYRLTANELAYILNDADSKVLFYENKGSAVVKEAIDIGLHVSIYIYTDEVTPSGSIGFYDLIKNGSHLKPSVLVNENDTYILMYTSGTTGRPKGVIHKHRDMVHHNFLMIECMKLSKNDIGLSVAPLNHTAELHTSFLPRIMVGATTVLLHHFQANEALRSIEQERVSHVFAAPTMVNMLLNVKEFNKYDLSSLRLLGYGGASMAPVLIRQFQSKTSADLVQMFGTTEMGPVMSVLYADEQLEKAGSAGKAILTHQIMISRVEKDEGYISTPEECGIGEIGEILVKGPCMMTEYYRLPEATAEALAYGWYHTGDMGYIDDEGFIWIKDRKDYMINTGAENVYPREVEDQLLENEGVLEVAVLGEPDETWGEVVVAYVVRRDERHVTKETLDEFLLQKNELARFKRPREYYFVDNLPKTASGKIQKIKIGT